MIGLTGLLPVPIVSVVIGEAAGAAGVALGIGDRILMQEHAVYTVGGAEGTDRRAAEPLAASRTLTAAECRRLGVADTIIPEPSPAAHADPEAASRALGAAIATALADLAGVGPRRLLMTARPSCALGQTTPEGREAAGARSASCRSCSAPWLARSAICASGSRSTGCPGISTCRSCRPRAGPGAYRHLRVANRRVGARGAGRPAVRLSAGGGMASRPGRSRIWRRSLPEMSETRARHDPSRWIARRRPIERRRSSLNRR